MDHSPTSQKRTRTHDQAEASPSKRYKHDDGIVTSVSSTAANDISDASERAQYPHNSNSKNISDEMVDDETNGHTSHVHGDIDPELTQSVDEFNLCEALKTDLFGSLESTAMTVLTTIQNAPPQHLSSISARNQSKHPHPLHPCHTSLKSLVQIYEPSSNFIEKDTLYTYPPEQHSALRKVNLALASLTLLSGKPSDLILIKDKFVDIFEVDKSKNHDRHLHFLLEIRLRLYVLLRRRKNGKFAAKGAFPELLEDEPGHEAPDTIIQQEFVERCAKAKAAIDQDPEQNTPSLDPLIHSLKEYIRESLQVFDQDDYWARVQAAVSAAHLRQGDEDRSENPPETLMQDQEPVQQKDGLYFSNPGLDVSRDHLKGHIDNGQRPTQELYQEAKLQATMGEKQKKTSTTNSKSSRSTWSDEERNALLQGLDRVRGPYWSQILGMFGASGTISDVLKDRTQVQLKDKARNLKLFFLKEGKPVPESLKHVTGELKNRTPTRATKDEARTDLENSAAEERATSHGLDALTTAHRQQAEAYGPWETQAGGSQYAEVAPQANMSNGDLGEEQMKVDELDAKETAERALKEAVAGSNGAVAI